MTSQAEIKHLSLSRTVYICFKRFDMINPKNIEINHFFCIFFSSEIFALYTFLCNSRFLNIYETMYISKITYILAYIVSYTLKRDFLIHMNCLFS